MKAVDNFMQHATVLCANCIYSSVGLKCSNKLRPSCYIRLKGQLSHT